MVNTLEVKRIRIDELSEDPVNARLHNDRNIMSIMNSLSTFGQQKPIVVDRNNVVRVGNGTIKAARMLGWTHLDCCVSDLTGSEMIAYAIADNRTAELAEWDMAQLIESIRVIEGDEARLAESLGFTQQEVEAMAPVFEPGDEGDQGQLDQLQEKLVICPKCKMEFDRREKK